jgi:phosphoglycolate phosphatase
MKIVRPIPTGKIKLLVFDLDGTLVDSKVDLANSINAMLRHLGHPELPLETIGTYIGDGAPMLVRRALGDPDDENYVQQALQYFLAYYRQHKLDHTYVYPGMIETLRALHAGNSRKMAVLTNKPVNPSRLIVEGLGMSGFFVQVYGGNSFHTKKPDPHGAHVLLQETGTQPDEAVIIGDSSNDILTGRNAGMWTVGLTYGFAPHTLESPEPDVLLDRPEELADLFGAKTA